MAKSRSKTGFADAFDPKRQSEVVELIINHLMAEQTVWPAAILIASSCAKRLNLATSPSDRLSWMSKLTSIEVDESWTAREAYTLFQLKALFSKRADIDCGVDREGVAVRSFLESESRCRMMNKALRNRDDPHYAERAALLHRMQRKISRCLGPLPSAEFIDFGFGPGTNIGCSKNTSVRQKLNSDATITVDAVSLLQGAHENVQTWPGLMKLKAVRGSRFTTVPKSWKTDRGIMVEPIVNSYLQKGYGKAIRNRLKRQGIDLTDQTVNQRLALVGSRDGSLATIDLSAASDSISYLLVCDLLPFDWFSALSDCRSHRSEWKPGHWLTLEKFSSMGNGATFELESLIFWAVVKVVCGEDAVISVYGDDIVCPSDKAEEVIAALSLLGFSTNVDKTFIRGPFRESCGKDYWDGTDVRPVFLKEAISCKEIYRLHNFFMRTGRLSGLPEALLRFVAKRDRHFGPDGLGDGVLIWTESPMIKIDKRGWEPFWIVRSWTALPRTVNTPLSSDYGAFIYRGERSDPLTDLSFEKTGYVERCTRPRYVLKNIRVRNGT